MWPTSARGKARKKNPLKKNSGKTNKKPAETEHVSSQYTTLGVFSNLQRIATFEDSDRGERKNI